MNSDLQTEGHLPDAHFAVAGLTSLIVPVVSGHPQRGGITIGS
ncbi:MAG: hypothetical protein ACJA1E_000061 [Paracoccaceae bacterium]|jgi:hypothetical protein